MLLLLCVVVNGAGNGHKSQYRCINPQINGSLSSILLHGLWQIAQSLNVSIASGQCVKWNSREASPKQLKSEWPLFFFFNGHTVQPWQFRSISAEDRGTAAPLLFQWRTVWGQYLMEHELQKQRWHQSHFVVITLCQCKTSTLPL